MFGREAIKPPPEELAFKTDSGKLKEEKNTLDKEINQAVTDLCQAQEKLRLTKPPLPSKKRWSSFI